MRRHAVEQMRDTLYNEQVKREIELQDDEKFK
jgi:hypothetical protein